MKECNCTECVEYVLEEGAHARRMGQAYLANPYKTLELKGAWATGWTQEDKALRLGVVD